MESAVVEEDTGSFEYKAAHQAFRDRWKETDETMCRHSMSFHLHHSLRSEFFASYLYLMEKIPVGKKKGHRLNHSASSSQSNSQDLLYILYFSLDSI